MNLQIIQGWSRTIVISALIANLSAGETIADETRYFQIPAQPLDKALLKLAVETGLELIVKAEKLRGLQSNVLNASLSNEQALKLLLQGSGMTFRFVDAKTVTIDNSPAQENKILEPQSTATLSAVKVVGKAVYDVTDPYNTDYVLPTATAGTKTDTPIMETPLNVQVVSKQVLKDQQAITLAQAIKNVSGVTSSLTPTDNTTAETITLRGFSSNTYFRNGFRLQQGSGLREMANVENVEILKGSAAILYGLVEPGGMVNVITKQPLATPYYAVQQQFGSYDLFRTTIDATGPISKDHGLLYRLNMSYEDSGSFRDFVKNQKAYIAPVFKWDISPMTQISLELEYSHDDLGVDYQMNPVYNGQLLRIPRSRNYGEPSIGKYQHYFGGLNWSHQFNDDWSIKQQIAVSQQKDNQPGLFPFTPALADDQISIPRLLLAPIYENNNYSTALDLTGHFSTAGVKHTLLIGGDYYRTDRQVDQNQSSNFSLIDIFYPQHCGNLCGLTFDPAAQYTYRQNTDQYGLYLQDQMQLPYNLHFTGGFRYQYIHQQGTFQGFGSSPVDDPTLQADALTPRVGLLWQARDWLSIYSNYTESFGANIGKVWPDKPVPPSSAEQWEVGVKTELFDGRLRATLAYFDLTKTNVATDDNLRPNQGFSVVAGAVRSRGPELDIQGEILPGWNVIATYANTDVVTTKTYNTYPAQGDRYYGVPRNTASFWNTYEFQTGDWQGLKVGGGITLRDNQATNDPSGANLEVPGYETVDLMAAYSRKVGKAKISVQFNVNNLLDKYYYTYIQPYRIPSSLGYDTSYVAFGTPRSSMGSIKIEF